MKEYPYKAFFSSIVKPVISKEKGAFLAKASLDQLRNFIPNIDTEANYDLLPVAFPLFNTNYFNKNDDGVDTAFALKIYKTFINKFIDLNHKRDKLVGVILSAHITEFGTDKPLTEEEVKDKEDVFNISVGGVLWRVVNENLAELIEESNSPLDENYDKIKASLEVGFTDYKIVVCPKGSRNLSEGTIIKESDEKEKLSSNLKVFGGTGSLKDGSRVYRLLSGEGIGLGCGITESPAAFLNAIAVPETTSEATIKNSDSVITVNIDLNNLENSIINTESKNKSDVSAKELSKAIFRVGESAKDASISIEKAMKDLYDGVVKADSVLELNQNKISQSENQNVIIDKNLRPNNKQNMKITSIKDITDESLKEVQASAIHEFIENELKITSEKFAKEKQEKETAAQELQKKHDEMVKSCRSLTEDLSKLKVNLEKLEQEKIARESQELFNTRMASFESKYELSEDELAVVGSQIKDLNDEQFKKVEANFHILLKNKDKSVIAEQKKTLKEVKADTAKVEQKTETQVVNKALETAQNVSKEVAATSEVGSGTQTLKQKFAKAFSPDQFEYLK